MEMGWGASAETHCKLGGIELRSDSDFWQKAVEYAQPSLTR